RLAEELHETAAGPVARDKRPAQRPRRAWTSSQRPQHPEEQEAFEQGLVELGGVPAERAAAGAVEDHAPGHVGDAPIQLAVDEVADAPQSQPDRDSRGGQVGDAVERIPFAPAEGANGDDDAKQSSVEGHPPFPDRQELRRMFEVVGQVIEEDVAETAAEEDRKSTRLNSSHVAISYAVF